MIREAHVLLAQNKIRQAEAVLHREYTEEIRALRARLSALAAALFDQIGMQLDVRQFGASHWERGATLETIDLPVTDREYYLKRIAFLKTLDESERSTFLRGLLNRCRAPKDGFYFSFAEHGLDAAGEPQTPDFYMDFQGDRPDVNNGTIPMAQLKLFDHFSFRCRIGGLNAGSDYLLRVSYSARKTPDVTRHRVSVNGHEIYCGPQYGGEKDARFDRWYLAPNTETATYKLHASCIENGCADLVIEEPTVGVMLSEFWIFPAEG